MSRAGSAHALVSAYVLISLKKCRCVYMIRQAAPFAEILVPRRNIAASGPAGLLI